jgi:hypothetical protein
MTVSSRSPFSLSSLTSGLQTLRSDVIRRRQVRVIENVSVVGLHPLGDALLVCSSAVSPAHYLSPPYFEVVRK